MKTIFLTTYDRIQIKNLLRTAFLDGLIRAGVRVVLLVPDSKADYYRREFGGAQVIVESVEQPRSGFFRFLTEQAATAAVRTSTIWSFYVQRARVNRHYAKYLWYLFAYCLLSNRFGWAVFRFLNRMSSIPEEYDAYFVKYKPDLVFATNITAPLDRLIARAAHKHGVRVLGANKSWDTLSSKGYLDIQADVVIAQNDLQAEELRTLQGYGGRVAVLGYPWFDFFLDRSALTSRDAFCAAYDLDPAKKIIFYFLSPVFIDPFAEEHIAVLSDCIEHGAVDVPAQILVIPRPKYGLDVERIRGLPHVCLFLPADWVEGAVLEWKEISEEEIREYRSQIHHADVIVNTGSTVSIEGALMDKPVISMDFDPKPVNYWRSVRVRHQDYHWRRLMRSGGVREAHGPEELADWLNRYLREPATDHGSRIELVRQQNHYTDAGSTQRWVQFVLELLA